MGTELKKEVFRHLLFRTQESTDEIIWPFVIVLLCFPGSLTHHSPHHSIPSAQSSRLLNPPYFPDLGGQERMRLYLIHVQWKSD